MVHRVGNAQFTGDVSNQFTTGLGEEYYLEIKLLRRALLDFLHNLGSTAFRIYPNLLLLHETGSISDYRCLAKKGQWLQFRLEIGPRYLIDKNIGYSDVQSRYA